MAEIAAAREASGCEALYREADEIEKACEIEDQICSTTATSLEGLLGQLQFARELMETERLDGRDDCKERLNASIAAGVKRLANGGPGSAAPGYMTDRPADDPLLALIAEHHRLAAQQDGDSDSDRMLEIEEEIIDNASGVARWARHAA
jgi:hypothetical protein